MFQRLGPFVTVVVQQQLAGSRWVRAISGQKRILFISSRALR